MSGAAGKSDAGVAVSFNLAQMKSVASHSAGLGLFYFDASPQPAARVTVQSWTGLSAQSAARQSDLRLQLPMW